MSTKTATTGSPSAPRKASSSNPKVVAARALGLLLPIAVIVLALDQFTKVWAERTLEVGADPIPLIGTFIQLRLIYNPGAALSMGAGMTWVLTLVSLAVVVFITITAKKLTSKAWIVTLGLLLGGALGNLGDRLFRAPGFPQGHVVDFLDYGIFIGNVADIAIVGAAILIAVLSIMNISPTVHAEADSGPAPEGQDADATEADTTEVADLPAEPTPGVDAEINAAAEADTDAEPQA